MAQIIVKPALYYRKGMPPEGKLPMATDDLIRASDVDREAVVATLRDAYMAGRLTMDEFDERMTAAYSGRTWGDLRPLTADLPVQPVLGSDIPGYLQPAEQTASLLQPQPSFLIADDAEPEGPVRPTADAELRRRRPAAYIIPIAFWALLVLHGNPGDGITALVVIVFLIAAFATAAFRR
jgi:hypothetical protein